MPKFVLLSACLVFLFPAQAFADYAPDKHPSTRAEVAAQCALLGDKGRSWGIEDESGPYGCQNAETGQALNCGPDGQCTDYVGDPRWRHIQSILKGAGQPKKLPL